MRWTDSLLLKACIYWSYGDPLPVDLFMEMTNAGLNVEQEQEFYFSIMNAD